MHFSDFSSTIFHFFQVVRGGTDLYVSSLNGPTTNKTILCLSLETMLPRLLRPPLTNRMATILQQSTLKIYCGNRTTSLQHATAHREAIVGHKIAASRHRLQLFKEEPADQVCKE